MGCDPNSYKNKMCFLLNIFVALYTKLDCIKEILRVHLKGSPSIRAFYKMISQISKCISQIRRCILRVILIVAGDILNTSMVEDPRVMMEDTVEKREIDYGRVSSFKKAWTYL